MARISTCRLLTTKALSLHPKWVLCGLYMGDDFENAFSMTYGLDYWSSLRTGHFGPVDSDIWGDDEPPGRFKVLRNWLSRESMMYRLVVHGPALGAINAALQFKIADRTDDPSVTTLKDDDGVEEAFRPIRVAAGLEQNRPEVREGMRITFYLLKEMDRVCRENACSFGVVIIPTRRPSLRSVCSAPRICA